VQGKAMRSFELVHEGYERGRRFCITAVVIGRLKTPAAGVCGGRSCKFVDVRDGRCVALYGRKSNDLRPASCRLSQACGRAAGSDGYTQICEGGGVQPEAKSPGATYAGFIAATCG